MRKINTGRANACCFRPSERAAALRNMSHAGSSAAGAKRTEIAAVPLFPPPPQQQQDLRNRARVWGADDAGAAGITFAMTCCEVEAVAFGPAAGDSAAAGRAAEYAGVCAQPAI